MKALFLGMSVATVMGLWAGGAMKPLSDAFEGGAQIMTPPPPARHVPQPWADAATWTSYGANIPDYVIGTDWIEPQLALASAAEAQEAEPPPAPQVKAAPPLPPPQLEERPAPEQRYPSLGGDILAGMDSYAPPTPPQDTPPEPLPAN